MKGEISLGVVCLARKTFDYKEAKYIYDNAKKDLAELENVHIHAIDDLVIEIDDCKKALDELRPYKLDGVVIISGTFHLGHLALMIEKEYKNLPILLWAFNELPYNGGKIRLNSVCGVNLNASNLYKAGYTNAVCRIGDTIDENWVDAVRMRAALDNSHVGIIGSSAQGFFNVSTDLLKLFSEYGVLVDNYQISSLFEYQPTEEEIEKELLEVGSAFNCHFVTKKQTRQVASLVVSTEHFLKENSLDAIAIRCWPEFAKIYGISPCAMMSVLQTKGYILGCEGDIEATLSMLACKALGCEAPFLADLSQVNLEKNFALMWHCGVAPYTLWDKKSVCSLDSYFAGGKGVTADFVLKSGEYSFLRIDTALGETRVFTIHGKAVPMEKMIKGTYAKVVFDNDIEDVLDAVTSTGIAHHVVMVYENYMKTFEEFAKIMKWTRIAA